MVSISVLFRALREREGMNKEIRGGNNKSYGCDVCVKMRSKELNKNVQRKYNTSHADVMTVFKNRVIAETIKCVKPNDWTAYTKTRATFSSQTSQTMWFRDSLVNGSVHPLPITWLFASAQPPYINLHRMLQRHKSARHRQWGRKKMRNVLAIHSSNNLTAELLLVQSS